MRLGQHNDFVPVIQKYDRFTAQEWIALKVEIVSSFRFISERIRLFAKITLPIGYISQDRMARFCGVPELRVCGNRDIDIISLKSGKIKF